MSMNNRITWELGLSDNTEAAHPPNTFLSSCQQACQAVSINAINSK